MQESDVQTMFLPSPMHVDIAVFFHGKPTKETTEVSDPSVVNVVESIAALKRFKSNWGFSERVSEGVIKISIGPP